METNFTRKLLRQQSGEVILQHPTTAHNRLQDFLREHNVRSKSQIRFAPQHCTIAHIYAPHILIDKHVHQNWNNIFACIVDFKKVIWYNDLLLKLIEKSVGGKIEDIVKTMYKY